LHCAQGKYDEAEALVKRALAIDEKVFGRDHPNIASHLNTWAGVLKKQVRVEECP
ncbi:unnamed protein product, partial [Laminaria digitata]